MSKYSIRLFTATLVICLFVLSSCKKAAVNFKNQSENNQVSTECVATETNLAEISTTSTSNRNTEIINTTTIATQSVKLVAINSTDAASQIVPTENKTSPTTTTTVSNYSSNDNADENDRTQNYDISSSVFNGYCYYSNTFSNMKKGTFKKKLLSNEPEIQICSELCDSIQVLNGFVYYISNGIIYKMDTDGNHLVMLDDSNYSEIKVAGNWIFAKSSDRLYMLKTDGSCKTVLSPGPYYDYASTSKILGFDRGYCYCMVEDSWSTKEGIHYNQKNLKIDYTASEPQIQNDFCYANKWGGNIYKIGFDRAFTQTSNSILITDYYTNTEKILVDKSNYTNSNLLGISKECVFYGSLIENKIYVINARTGEINCCQLPYSFSSNDADFMNDSIFVTLNYGNVYKLIMVNGDGMAETIYVKNSIGDSISE